MCDEWASRSSHKPKAQLDAEFSDLYRAHLRDVYSYAYYRVGNHHDAEDLTEQTFLQAYRHFERAQRESRRPAAATVADPDRAQPRREPLSRPRAQAGLADRRDDDADRAAHDRAAGRGARAGAPACSTGCSRLPEDRREALIMRFALGMDNREIARALGRSDGATKVLIHRAIKQLEGLVGDRRTSAR